MNTLIIFSGLPGTGKSTLANKLARALRVPLLCIDDVVGDVPENPGVEFWDAKVAILLGLAERQLELSLSVIVDSVFMNTDRNHAQSIAYEQQARFRPIFNFISDEEVWKQRVSARYERINKRRVADWERIQFQRGHFRAWQPGTALWVDALNPVEENYQAVLHFVMSETVELEPLEAVPWQKGRYH